ncbi:MAG: hypothetical protein CI947_2251 [Halanaerobium sp.]|nr:MAG: hypothetical protein CI947_2251 [Halanaerobium sp.]
MDQSLEPRQALRSNYRAHEVSILILVDQSLERSRDKHLRIIDWCFNPYSSGSVIGTSLANPASTTVLSFNPYSSGSVIGTFDWSSKPS